MSTEHKDAFFAQYGRVFSTQQVNHSDVIPFQDHPQFSMLVDVLSRKHNHHAILCADFSATLHEAFLEAFTLYLAREHTPLHLRHASPLYLALNHLRFSVARQKAIEEEFETLCESLDHQDTYQLIVLPNIDWMTRLQGDPEESFMPQMLQKLMNHPRCRLLALVNAKTYTHHAFMDSAFSLINVVGFNHTDILTILKQQRDELEAFHHVLIPEELLLQAHALAERYLSADSALEKALQLLDSSAARTSAHERVNHHADIKPVLTLTTLTHVLSNWTRIPVTQLPPHKWKHADFIQGLQQKIIGQEAAITLVGQAFQQAQAHLHQSGGPFYNLLFAGPKHSGKKTLAIALAEQLYRHTHMLFFAQPASSTLTSLADINLHSHENRQSSPLTTVIRTIPYAIILFEDVDQASPAVMDGLLEILSTGYLHDETGHAFSFKQATILLTTTLGTTRLTEIAPMLSPDESGPDMDLLQLVMCDHKQEKLISPHYPPQDLAEEIMPEVAAYLPASLCQHVHLVPFIPLNKSAIEKIMRLKLSSLNTLLEVRYGIELGYAPEVLHYLAGEAIRRKDTGKHQLEMDRVEKQLYFTVEQAILCQSDNKNRPNQLLLRLDETGQMLCCEWLSANAVRHHAS